ncbi:MAG: ABC transporter permease [Gammaproteobacteria bacterium]|jgi:oligopeptide transport system permease protein|nr:ABC transporter permease [Gammaproteobacteria bacterium]
MSTVQPTAADFEPVKVESDVEQISRPSLSYWQDAWVRLKKNTRAIVSLWIIILLTVFTLIGPFIWQVDPALQDLNQVSQSPSWPKSAVVVEAYSTWDGIRIDGYQSPDNYPEQVAAPTGFRAVGDATTQRVRLSWDAVAGADGYNIYRNNRQPQDFNDLGLPLGSTYGDELSYEDRLSLEDREYYYAVVPTDGIDEYESYTLLTVTPQLALTHEEANTRGLAKSGDHLAVGDQITIEFHPMGTDYLGRDMLARLMEGARVSLFIGIVAPFLYVFIGIVYGGFAGYFSGKLDVLLMRFADFVVALPFLLFMILFKIAFGIGPGESGIFPMLIALVLLGWPATARLVRGQVLQIREQGYIEAARLLGAKDHYLILRHIIPNTMGVILVTLTFAVPAAIFTEAFLSFIGMGVAPPTPSWGSMCNEGVKTMLSHPHELIFPAVLISITVLAFNLLGDGLTEALDSRMRSRE